MQPTCSLADVSVDVLEKEWDDLSFLVHDGNNVVVGTNDLKIK